MDTEAGQARGGARVAMVAAVVEAAAWRPDHSCTLPSAKTILNL